MQPFVNDIHFENPNPNIYEQAVNVLRFMGRHGFSEKAAKDGTKVYVFKLDQDSVLPAQLVQVAAIATDPAIRVDFNQAKSTMELRFPATAEKPPVRAMRANLEKIPQSFIECIRKDEKSGDYIVSNPKKFTFDPVALATMFLHDGELCTPYYRLPEDIKVFIDAEGLRHTSHKLIHAEVMQQYLDQYEGGKSFYTVSPEEIAIPPEAMQRIVDQLGLGTKKGVTRN